MEQEKLNQAIASLIKSGNKDAIAEMIVEYVQPNHITTDFVGMLLNTRSLNPGDSLVKKLRKGITVHSLVPGTIHLASEVTVSDRVHYILDGSDVKVIFNEWELENGEIGTVESIRAEMAAKLKDHFQNKMFTALSTVWSSVNTADNYISAGGAITSTILEDAIDQINQTTSGVKAVVGTRAAMTPISKFAGFYTDPGGSNYVGLPDALEELRQRGKLGKYYGADLVMIDQVYDNPEDYNTLLPTDKILIIGENVGEFITFGEAKTKQWTDMRPTPPNWFLELYQQYGLLIWNAMGIYVVGGIS